ncbi:MAG: AAA family ATPase [Candidatus Acetothermia bacterium]|jgi:lon-related putative ATP-dependent protease|nr:AAA family ATPase [Candidatus Acetothermia bacterium]
MVEVLTPDRLRRACDPRSFSFATTDELEPLSGIIGQDRALEALYVGLRIKDPRHRYNIFVSGEPGLGKTSAVTHFLAKVSRDQPTPPDICYVHNFHVPHAPRYLLLPAGRGRELRADMDRCVEFLARELPKVLESEEFKARAKKERERFAAERDGIFHDLEARAAALGFTVQRTPVGINTIPLKPDGAPYSQEEYESLPAEERAAILRRQEELQELVRDTFQRLGQLEEAWQEAQRHLTKQAVQFLIEPRFAQLRAKYADLDRVQTFLSEVQADIVENVEQLQAANKKPPLPVPMLEGMDRFHRYRVNVIVDRSGTEGAPVVVEENATYTNLVGTVERKVQFGVVTTDFTQIRAGSLHRASGGYLVLSATNLLRFSLSWEALKIALKTGEIRIEDPAQMLGFASTEGLRPEPVPLDVKVIVIGSPYLYHLLHSYDEDFRKLFTIRADFDTEMPWTEDAPLAVARFIRARRDEDPSVLPFAPSGVARVVEYAAELAGDQKKLATRFASLAFLVKEASFWAREAGAAVVDGEHVRVAINKGRSRHSLIAEKVREWIARGKLMVDVHGATVGQVNSLAVIDLGEMAFGKPSRITANVFTGKDGVVDIEREAELGGKLHTKGVMILKGYLGAKFARQKPLSLAASLALEQSYTGVEGDSASAAELYALLSALAGVPLKQGIAVTGAIDQKGRLQPIGGVNEKIEGHYLVCKELGLTGDQGVIIPRGNVDDLMLPEEVVQAVAEARFHVWACDTADEGIELLTGMAAGEPDPEGNYPQGTLFYLVARRLEEIRESLRTAEEKDEGD